ncbi:MAG: hypothetical protein PHT95_01610 [Candidatus Omnitrophica bacterium]|jgi:hypothetical protein|nr:hypothetical protein [Candidatus Omnitrophota bacterium]MDD4012962.1 hypothetical protein [Candidatus Omnitrophota bacterium]
MKELVYKNISGGNPRKCVVSIEEKNDPVEKARSRKWVCKYFVKERHTARDLKSLNDWVNFKKKEGCERNCHILKKTNSHTGENTLVCKVLGEFFVVRGLTAFKLLYVNEVRLDGSGPGGSDR